jgi:hypothetical protein
MTEEEYEEEIKRLHEFIKRLANRLYLASEVLSIRAEKKEVRALVCAGSCIHDQC